jgi:hypothetical protein
MGVGQHQGVGQYQQQGHDSEKQSAHKGRYYWRIG